MSYELASLMNVSERMQRTHRPAAFLELFSKFDLRIGRRRVSCGLFHGIMAQGIVQAVSDDMLSRISS